MGLWDRIHGEGTVGQEAASPGPTLVRPVTASGGPEAIDLRSRPPEIWGRPGRCPACGGVGYLDQIDVIDRVQYEHCTECFHKWSVNEAETASVHS